MARRWKPHGRRYAEGRKLLKFGAPGPGPAGLLDLRRRDGAKLALFLDFDGTLLEVAPTPGAAVAPEGLPDLLGELSAALGGALALVTGREIADLDLRLAPYRGAAAGVHGAEIRFDPERQAALRAEALDPAVLEDVRRLAVFEPRLLIEDKGASIAVHFRAAETAEPFLERKLRDYVAGSRGGLRLLRGRKVFEVLGGGFSKGEAVARFMAAQPFAGRTPVMIGDDLTDQPAMQACIALGGFGFAVAGDLFRADRADFAGPEAVRAWLRELAALMGDAGGRAP